MSVYVDPLMQHGWMLGANCHMFADSIEELHAWATGFPCAAEAKIGDHL